MITVTISYISFIEKNAAGTGARVAFPKQGHELKIFRNKTQIAAGENISLVVTNGGGAANTGAVTGLPMGGRVMSVHGVAGGGPYSLLPDSELLAAAGPAQAVLRLPGGTWTALDPITKSRYKDAYWSIGGKLRQLTDTVQWTIPYQNTFQYSLVVDGVAIALANHDVLTFTNDDDPGNVFQPNLAHEVELTELHYIYGLVTPAPASRPIPATPALAPTPAPAAAPGVPVVFDGDFIPDQPLCPVTQP